MKLTEDNIIITDRHSDLVFTECMVIECTDEHSAKDFKQQILDNQKKAKSYYCLKKWIEEIRVPTEESDEPYTLRKACSWIIGTCENEILNGEYLDDEEYEQMLKEEKK